MKTTFSDNQIKVYDLGPESEVFYHPKWLSFPDAIRIYQALYQAIPFQQHRVAIAGTIIDQPRLTCWFGEHSYRYSGLTINPDPWLPELLELRTKLENDLGINFNSVLANLYRNGQDGIGWHADAEQQIGPVIASISLGGLREFRIRNPKANKQASIEMQTGSLLVMAGDTQKHCQHSITKAIRNVQPRINLTFRVLTGPI